MNATATNQPDDELIPLDEVKRIAGVGKTMIYRLERAGRFPKRVWMPPVLQGDSRTFWRLGAYIARVSGLFAWLIVCHWPVCSSKNEVHIGSKSYDARAPGLVSTS